MRTLPLIILFFPILLAAQAKSLVERVYEAQSPDKNPASARRQMIDQATLKVSEELIKEIIGENKFHRNQALIQNKILKNSARFVPYAKPGEMLPRAPEEGYKMSVSLRVSIEDLQNLLLENGLFYESDSTPVVLPAIRLVDRVSSKSYGWWMDLSAPETAQKSFLIKIGRSLETQLKAAFSKHNFYSLKPQTMKLENFIPAAAKTENLRTEDWHLMAQRMGAPILVDGEMVFTKSQERSDAYHISLRMTATQVANSRVIAEVTRQFETEAGEFERVMTRKLKEVLESTSQDLAAQMLEAWQRGSLGATLYKLTVRGRLPLIQQEAFKEALKSKVREIKNIRERLISTEAVTYEVEAAIGPKELAQKAPLIQLSGVKMVLESSSDKEATYRVSK